MQLSRDGGLESEHNVPIAQDSWGKGVLFCVRHYLCHLNTVTLDIGNDLRKLQLLILFWDADF